MAPEGKPTSFLGLDWFRNLRQEYNIDQTWNEEDVVLVFGRIVQNSLTEN